MPAATADKTSDLLEKIQWGQYEDLTALGPRSRPAEVCALAARCMREDFEQLFYLEIRASLGVLGLVEYYSLDVAAQEQGKGTTLHLLDRSAASPKAAGRQRCKSAKSEKDETGLVKLPLETGWSLGPRGAWRDGGPFSVHLCKACSAKRRETPLQLHEEGLDFPLELPDFEAHVERDLAAAIKKSVETDEAKLRSDMQQVWRASCQQWMAAQLRSGGESTWRDTALNYQVALQELIASGKLPKTATTLDIHKDYLPKNKHGDWYDYAARAVWGQVFGEHNVFKRGAILAPPWQDGIDESSTARSRQLQLHGHYVLQLRSRVFPHHINDFKDHLTLTTQLFPIQARCAVTILMNEDA